MVNYVDSSGQTTDQTDPWLKPSPITAGGWGGATQGLANIIKALMGGGSGTGGTGTGGLGGSTGGAPATPSAPVTPVPAPAPVQSSSLPDPSSAISSSQTGSSWPAPPSPLSAGPLGITPPGLGPAGLTQSLGPAATPSGPVSNAFADLSNQGGGAGLAGAMLGMLGYAPPGAASSALGASNPLSSFGSIMSKL